ncbi:MAG: DUF1214 domain-containing protein [Planctomycetota bacterium]
MKKTSLVIAAIMLICTTGIAGAEEKKVDVNLSNIRTVETHIQFNNYQKIAGINTWKHNRNPVDIDNQTTIAMNRDTFYSFAVLDLTKPVTITMPEAKGRYMSLQIIDEDHYSPFVYEKPGTYKLTEKNVGTRYAFAAVRTFVNPNDPKDVKAVHALQDAMEIKGGSGEAFKMPNYDMDRYKALAANIQKLIGFWNGDTRGAMGKRGEVDELMHTVATIAGWGLQPPENAMYSVVNLGLDPNKKYKIVVPADVPVKAFWSISIYNAKGYFQKNDLNAYSLNNLTAKKNGDRTTTIYLGGCENGQSNCLPMAGKGFYHQWRMYGPEKPILEGKWSFPDPVELK